ncbi:hypothetical protein GE061_018812 [Apolygus lucorum]|uniref:EGF-like domain-containing protein n=1 Tax=Apolygus lucorum TaxID=248454 RepID=A0A8S9X6M3_APOLU|nr:hypothetical protein GE061_018812 [Apolygus lucorum]
MMRTAFLFTIVVATFVVWVSATDIHNPLLGLRYQRNCASNNGFDWDKLVSNEGNCSPNNGSDWDRLISVRATCFMMRTAFLFSIVAATLVAWVSATDIYNPLLQHQDSPGSVFEFNCAYKYPLASLQCLLKGGRNFCLCNARGALLPCICN